MKGQMNVTQCKKTKKFSHEKLVYTCTAVHTID